MSWLLWRRLQDNRHPGFCPDCGHIWREHPGGGSVDPFEPRCAECEYEVENGKRAAGAECTSVAP